MVLLLWRFLAHGRHIENIPLPLVVCFWFGAIWYVCKQYIWVWLQMPPQIKVKGHFSFFNLPQNWEYCWAPGKILITCDGRWKKWRRGNHFNFKTKLRSLWPSNCIHIEITSIYWVPEDGNVGCGECHLRDVSISEMAEISISDGILGAPWRANWKILRGRPPS